MAFFVINPVRCQISQKTKKQVKTQKYLIGLLYAVLFTFILNLNAAITAEKVWDPPSRFVAPNERVQFVQYRIQTDVAVNIESVTVKSVGAVHLAFEKIVIRNGFGRVIGETKPNSNVNLTIVPIEKTIVLPSMIQFLTLEGESTSSFPSELIERGISVVAIWMFTSDGIVPLEQSPTIYTPSVRSRSPGVLAVSPLGSPSSVQVGERRFLGGFSVNAIGGNIGAQILLNFHVMGGSKEDVRNLTAIALNAKGDWYFLPIAQRWEYGDVLSDYALQGNLEFSGGMTLVGIFADVGQSFSGGGTIAVSATPAKWEAWDISTGTRPVLSNKTVVGPTVRVVPTHGDGGGKG